MIETVPMKETLQSVFQ